MTDPLETVDWPVHTPRLRLRRATPEDAEATFAFRSRPEVYEWITEAASDPEYYRARFERPDRFGKTLVIERDGTVIGDLMLEIDNAWSQREVAEHAAGTQAGLGWVLDPAYAGQGYATEAVRAVIDLCFGPLGLRRVYADCFADNEPSWRLMERLGMRREAHSVKDSLHRSGEWLDGLCYALLAEEWDGQAG